MFCPNCGAQNQDNTPKCTACGHTLQAAGAAPARPAPKFKGTMLMSGDQMPPIPRSPGAGPQAPQPPQPPGGYPKTMIGGMAAFDSAHMGGGAGGDDVPESATIMQSSPFDQGPPSSPPGHSDSLENARTLAVDASAFGFDTAPQGSGGAAPSAGKPATAAFGAAPPFQAPQASAPPFQAHQPPPQQPSAPPFQPQPSAPPFQAHQPPHAQAESGVSSTVAVDASSFGLGPGGPPPGPAGGVNATMAVDASAFGLGGPGGPGGPGFGGPPQGGQQNFGGPPQGGPQNFGGPPPGGPQNFGGPPQGGPQNFGGPPQGGPQNFGGPPPGGVNATMAVDASAFGLGGPGGPGGPGFGGPPGGPQGFGGPPPGGPQGYPGGPGGPPPGMQQGYGPPQGFGQPGFGQPQTFGPGPAMQPLPTAPKKGGKAGLVIGLLVLLLFIGGGVVAVLMRGR